MTRGPEAAWAGGVILYRREWVPVVTVGAGNRTQVLSKSTVSPAPCRVFDSVAREVAENLSGVPRRGTQYSRELEN